MTVTAQGFFLGSLLGTDQRMHSVDVEVNEVLHSFPADGWNSPSADRLDVLDVRLLANLLPTSS